MNIISAFFNKKRNAFNYVKIVFCLQIKKKKVYLYKSIMLLFRFPIHGEIDALKLFYRNV